MKTQNFSLALLLLVIFTFQVQAEKTTKRIYRSFPVSQVAKLELSNKYGHIQIDDNRKDSVVISVEISVEGSDSRAQKLLDNIDVNISTSGKIVSATTDFKNDLKINSREFSIDYLVSVPADRDLNVSNKYGKVNMNNLTGKGIFNIMYGELRAKELLSPELTIDIAYSKASIDATRDLKLAIRYSKLTLTKGDNLNLNSKYSGLNLGDCKDVLVESKYDDIRFKTISSITANSMYTGYKLDQVLTSVKLTNGYGDFTVASIPASFNSIRVSSKYATIRLGIEPGASYKLDGKARYCELKHPSGKLNRSKEDFSLEVQGTVGEAESPAATVNIESSYGNVILTK